MIINKLKKLKPLIKSPWRVILIAISVISLISTLTIICHNGHDQVSKVSLPLETTRIQHKYYENITQFSQSVFETQKGLPVNEEGLPFDIIPNIVHYILFTICEIQFAHFVSILSIFKNQRPELIYIHSDCDQLSGQYWRRVLRVSNKTNTKIIVRYIERPTEIWGQKLSEQYLNWHSSDITRLSVLSQFGGIYLDTDVYVVQSLKRFFKYEMTLDWDRDKTLELQTIIAYKNARFLRLWLESYQFYDPTQWVYNSEVLPTKVILVNRPDLIHRVYGKFGPWGPTVCPLLYSTYYEDWQTEYYAFHLYMRGNSLKYHKNWCFDGKEPNVTEFDEHIVKNLSVTFGQMARMLFDYEINT